jgi:hypothetical protein
MLQQLAQTQIEQLKLVKSQHWQDFFFDSLKSNHPLDLGPQTRQVLLKNKTFAYRDVLQPFENELEGKVIVRTGECSGQFVLQVS